jgi:hypothetical protein
MWLVGFLAGCASTDVTPLLSTDDCGPRPDNYKTLAAEWLNKHCHYTPPNPIKPNELSTTSPTRVATIDQMHGRTVGWQIILGPENKAVRDYSDSKYTRMIINHGRIVSVTSDNQLSALVPPPPKKKKAH